MIAVVIKIKIPINSNTAIKHIVKIIIQIFAINLNMITINPDCSKLPQLAVVNSHLAELRISDYKKFQQHARIEF